MSKNEPLISNLYQNLHSTYMDSGNHRCKNIWKSFSEEELRHVFLQIDSIGQPVSPQERLEPTPKWFYWLSVHPICVRIDKVRTMIHCAMNESLTLQSNVSFPLIRYDYRSRQHPSLEYTQQRCCALSRTNSINVSSGRPLTVPPKTHCCSTRLPLLYLRRATNVSSISRIVPGPPIWTPVFSV